MTSKEGVICPFCKQLMGKTKVLGDSGLVCIAGRRDAYVICDGCKNEFYCDVKIQYTFRTRKKLLR